MMKYLMLFLLGVMLNCSNPAYVICPVRLHFQSDVSGLGLKNLHALLRGDNIGKIDLDSNDFFTCPTNNDTCDDRRIYLKVPKYTINVPMTREVDFSMADNKINIMVILTDTNDTLFGKSYIFEPQKPIVDYLIYLGYVYDESQNKLKDFITAARSESRKNSMHISFPIEGTPANNDSLYLVWLN